MGKKEGSTAGRSTTGGRTAQLEFVNKLLLHDIANYLTVIKGNVKLLVDGLDAPEATDRLRTIERQTEAASTLLRDVSVIIDGPRANRPLEPVNVDTTLESELTHMRAAYPNAEISTDCPSGITVRADALLGSVFGNLLRNAIQHNDKEHPRVQIDVETIGERASIEIADNGPGIDEELKNTIFEKGTKGFESPGTGFGLHLVREIVSSYDGSVEVRDNTPRGSIFEVSIPLAGNDRPE
ncbi:MAG: sensor histidine kinase [Halobacteriaceae archaeon]